MSATAHPSFTLQRLTTAVPGVREFQRRYEAAVPDLPAAEVAKLLQRGAPWSEMEALIESSAPHGFLFYAKNNAGPLMQAAGDDSDCLWYLMGNHILAERMFRHDPRIMLYAPLRTVLWEDHSGDAWFTLDQPSSQFASFGIPEIAEVGVELDRKVAALLRGLEVDVPPELQPWTSTRGGEPCRSTNAQPNTDYSPTR